MITPAVMILATSSLILTTTNRLVRIVRGSRSRDDSGSGRPASLAQLYLGLAAFLATSIALGVVSFARLDAGWVPLLLGAIGVALLFSASILLIVESRMALASAYAEMDYIRRISGHLAPTETHKARGRGLLR